MSATETPARVSREILEDRWEGLMYAATEPTRLQRRLWRLTRELITGVARQDRDDNGLYGGHDLETWVGQELRSYIIRRVDELGLAR